MGSGMNGGPIVCVRCEPALYNKPRYSKPKAKSVPVAVNFGDESLCPEHYMVAIKERGLTLDQSFGCWHD